MGETTAIAWTDHTFNPWWGCTNVSPGCDHCYAESFARRTGHDVWGKTAGRRFKQVGGRTPTAGGDEMDGQRHKRFPAGLVEVADE